ncbi:hypothetical protein B0T19DRAFT_421240 [Cercophora scortea]|uniref:Uncharacterized protein n=1 Tax=Cercophora scortea TaxID=314031 RepID=A0AAE0ILE4_9PEZI|nr:hypothetical protein B0T19DRAFT_421240 [Cercophora scortea]
MTDGITSLILSLRVYGTTTNLDESQRQLATRTMSDIFALPDAKRVRREDLYDTDSVRDSSPDEHEAENKARLNARLSALLSLKLDAPSMPIAAADGDDHAATADERADEEPDEAPEFEFRLFSTSSASQKVVLAPLEDKHVQAEIVSQRPLSYYIRGDLTPQERERFRYAAVSGRDVMQWANQRAWGLEVPWRVTKITLSSSSSRQVGDKTRENNKKTTATGLPAQDPSAKAGAKKRPGKKRRIALRVKEKAEKEAAAALAMKRMTKEEHLKEKKKRLNREKKLKRRKKEKEKKLGGGSATGAADGGEQSESDHNDMES